MEQQHETKAIHNMKTGRLIATWTKTELEDECPSAWDMWSLMRLGFPCCIVNDDGTLYSRM